MDRRTFETRLHQEIKSLSPAQRDRLAQHIADDQHFSLPVVSDWLNGESIPHITLYTRVLEAIRNAKKTLLRT